MWLLEVFKRKPAKPELELLLEKAMKLGEEADALKLRRQAVKAQIDEILRQRHDATVEGVILEAEVSNG